jgi:hypothetical protein
MKKFGMNNPFDLEFIEGGEVVIHIDTAKEVSLQKNGYRNKLIVKDALVDIDLINDIFNVNRRFMKFSVVGESYARDLDTYYDKRVSLKILEVELVKCIFPTGIEPSVVTLEFDFPNRVDELQNMTLKVNE